jgi:hypothetical protein
MKREFKPKPPQMTAGELERLPAALSVRDLARIFNVAIGTIYGYHYSGALRRFELGKPIGARRWSGKLVRDYLEGGGNRLEMLRRQAG